MRRQHIHAQTHTHRRKGKGCVTLPMSTGRKKLTTTTPSRVVIAADFSFATVFALQNKHHNIQISTFGASGGKKRQRGRSDGAGAETPPGALFITILL